MEKISNEETLMRFNNTTDIPTKTIVEAMLFSMQDGVEIAEVVIRNKKENHISGQWGWYFPREKKVVLIVPQVLKNFQTHTKYAKIKITLRDRTDFVYAIMAHELRHAYQWQVRKEYLGHSRSDMLWREFDAESYEVGMLRLYQQQEMKAAACVQP